MYKKYLLLALVSMLFFSGCLNIDEQKETKPIIKNEKEEIKTEDKSISQVPETQENKTNETLIPISDEKPSSPEMYLRIDEERYITNTKYSVKITSNAEKCYYISEQGEISLKKEFVIGSSTTYVAEFKEPPSYIFEKEVTSTIECYLGDKKKSQSFKWVVDTKPPVLPSNKKIDISVDDISYTKRSITFNFQPATDFSKLRYYFKGTIDVFGDGILFYTNTTEQNSTSNKIVLNIKIPSHTYKVEKYIINGEIKVFDSFDNSVSYGELKNKTIEI